MSTAVQNLQFFKILYIFNVFISALIVILVGVWTGVYLNGLGWTGSIPPVLQLNWHPLLMVTGFVFMQGNAILIYRGLRTINKAALKIAHASIHFLSVPVIIVGLIAAFSYHTAAGSPHLYSIHSWIGILAVVMFVLQWSGGFLTFRTSVDLSIRQARMPLHIFFGISGYMLSMLAIFLGLIQRAINSPNYTQLPPVVVLINCIFLLVVIHSGVLVFIVTKTAFKRVPLPGEVPAIAADANVLQ